MSPSIGDRLGRWSLVLVGLAFVASYAVERLGSPNAAQTIIYLGTAAAALVAAFRMLANPPDDSRDREVDELMPDSKEDGGREPGPESMPLHDVPDLVARIGHDIANHLTAARGYLLLLRDQGVPGIDDRVAEIEGEITYAFRTVRSAMALVRSPSLESEVIPLRELIEESLDIARAVWKTRSAAGDRRIELEAAYDESAVLGRRDQLIQVLLNLIINGIDAMPGGGRLLVRAEAGASQAFVSVSDTGIGIDPGVADRVFEPFVSTKGAHGTGLGLARVKSVVEAHGGTITVERRDAVQTGFDLAEGTAEQRKTIQTVFTLTLPLAERVSAGPHGWLGEVGSRRTSLGRVLIVDDEVSLTKVLAETLRSAGHDVTVSSSGGAAIAEVRRRRFDVVVTDLIMPDVGGFKVAAEVKRLSPETTVVLISAFMHDPSRSREEWLAKGVDVFIEKSRAFEDLPEALKLATGRPGLEPGRN